MTYRWLKMLRLSFNSFEDETKSGQYCQRRDATTLSIPLRMKLSGMEMEQIKIETFNSFEDETIFPVSTCPSGRWNLFQFL